MTKIGRNDQCPCGSGHKYKRCCLPKNQAKQNAQLQPQKVSINDEVGKLQVLATNHEESMKVIGVFIFFSTKEGDAWLLELSEMDAVCVAKAGEKMAVEINESAETIEVNWSHQFVIKEKVFTTTAYLDKTVTTYNNYPTASISATVKKLQSRFSSELLEKIHVDPS
ncbi:MAG: SEC-C domain-containing protein [Desulfobulbaceae bacterium]|nr:SEC-C domain-containing protein [Desulfobulbaceae bacterium]